MKCQHFISAKKYFYGQNSATPLVTNRQSYCERYSVVWVELAVIVVKIKSRALNETPLQRCHLPHEIAQLFLPTQHK